MHQIFPVPEVLRVDDVFSGVRYTLFDDVYEFQLRSNSDFFVTPQTDTELDVEICGQVETVPCYSDLCWIAFMNGVVGEIDSLSCCSWSFCKKL